MNGLILNMAKYGLFLRVLKDPIVQFVIEQREPPNYSNYNKLLIFFPNKETKQIDKIRYREIKRYQFYRSIDTHTLVNLIMKPRLSAKAFHTKIHIKLIATFALCGIGSRRLPLKIAPKTPYFGQIIASLPKVVFRSQMYHQKKPCKISNLLLTAIWRDFVAI